MAQPIQLIDGLATVNGINVTFVVYLQFYIKT